jgi:hypothetical protein
MQTSTLDLTIMEVTIPPTTIEVALLRTGARSAKA